MEDNNIFKQGILGLFIGLAVIIPGFSGAQIAILFKLYDKLMAALGNLFNKKSLLFLLPIAVGGILGFVMGLVSVKLLLEISLFAVVACFAGLMLGGMPSVIKEVKDYPFKPRLLVNSLIGLLIPLTISILAVTLKVDLGNLLMNTPWYMYLLCLVIGVLVALTQLIPGLSATALLMTFGLYDALMSSISLEFWQANPQVLAIYVCLVTGAIAGVILISKFITKMLAQHKQGFYYLIIGLCFGSIITMFYNPEIVEFYTNWNASSWIHLVVGITLFVISTIGIYLAIRYISKKELKTNN